MKNKKIMGGVFGIPVLVVVLIIIIILNEPERDGIARTSAYKAVALSMTTAQQCKKQAETESSFFSEKDKQNWYVKYMDYLYLEDIISLEFTPPETKIAEGWLTYEEADYVASQISNELSDYVKVTKRNAKKHYPKEQWWLLYDEVLKITDEEANVKHKKMQVFGTALNVEGAPPWTVYTNVGTWGFEGLSLDSYIDSEINAVVRDGEIIRIIEQVSEDVIYRNVWIKAASETEVEGYVGSITRTFKVKKKLNKSETMENSLADLYISSGQLKKVVLKKEKISGKVLEVKDTSIEIEGYGEIPLDENFNIYKMYGEFKQQSMSDILVGYDVQEFVVADGKLCAALTMREFEAETIRVLIMNTGFRSLFHENITLNFFTPTTMIMDEKERTINAGETMTISLDDESLKRGRIIFQPSDEAKGIGVESVNRSQGTPVYPGRLEIKMEDEGLVLVNELYMEDYLKRVVPSEMPSSYEKEALKAQAVCARTYVYGQIRSNTYMQYGAHIDDSTRFQVYNNIQTNNKTDAAVNETYGKLLMYQDEPIEAYYFSTSCGYTTDGTIWGADLSSVPYLKGVESPYETEFPWYRWNTSITSTQLEQNVTDVGNITNVTIKENGPGGIGRVMEVTGTDGSRTITGESQIRSALGHPDIVISKNDGKTVTGWSSLPSAFITVSCGEPDADQITTFRISGGGYGHGVGMSQNGAQGLAKTGKNYVEILKHYYDGIEVKELPVS